jgi:hypothetical protein
LGSECYAAVVGVGAPNTADKEDRISLSDAVECGGMRRRGVAGVVSVASKKMRGLVEGRCDARLSLSCTRRLRVRIVVWRGVRW